VLQKDGGPNTSDLYTEDCDADKSDADSTCLMRPKPPTSLAVATLSILNQAKSPNSTQNELGFLARNDFLASATSAPSNSATVPDTVTRPLDIPYSKNMLGVKALQISVES